MKMLPIDMNGEQTGPEGWVTFDARKLNGPLFFEDVVDDDGFFSPLSLLRIRTAQHVNDIIA